MDNQFEKKTDHIVGNCEEEQKSLEDYTCSICLCLLAQPVTLPCHHSFCLQCLKIKCPNCRSKWPTKVGFDLTLAKEIISQFPKDYKERINKIQGISQEKEKEKLPSIKLLYGNHNEHIRNGKPARSDPSMINEHSWCFYVKISQCLSHQYISKIHIILDPTFGDDPIILRAQPFELSRVGYGEFTIECQVFFQRKTGIQPITITHDLKFVPQGHHLVKTVQLPVKQEQKQQQQQPRFR